MASGNLIAELLGGLQRATDADLFALDAEIEARDRDLAALRHLRHLIARRLGRDEPGGPKRAGRHSPPAGPDQTTAGTPPAQVTVADQPTYAVTPKPTATATESGTLGDRRSDVLRLLRAKGPQSQDRVGEALGISKFGRANLGSVLASDWFHVAPDGVVSLTDKGDRAARETE